MIRLPQRTAPYILVGLLLVLIGIVWWLIFALKQLQSRGEGKAERNAEAGTEQVPTSLKEVMTIPELPAETGLPAPSFAMDEGLKTLSERMHLEDEPPETDLEILEEVLSIYRKVAGGNPAGDNSDFTEALVGQAPEGIFFSRSSPAYRDGELVDRWGTPYWFHPVTSHVTEIRSAGPDRQLFTADDVVINPSPAGLGATAELEVD
jgi:hypothetical protein